MVRMVAETRTPAMPARDYTVSWTAQLGNNRNFLGLLFMLPAAAVLLLFLAYPLGLGVWLIVKGFNPSAAILSEPDKTDLNERQEEFVKA